MKDPKLWVAGEASYMQIISNFPLHTFRNVHEYCHYSHFPIVNFLDDTDIVRRIILQCLVVNELTINYSCCRQQIAESDVG